MTRSRRLLRRRRERARRGADRGLWCEAQQYSGEWYGARCIYPATHYNLFNDIFVCGIHKRAYTHTATIASIRAWNDGTGPDPYAGARP